jgi:hypothetical protein
MASNKLYIYTNNDCAPSRLPSKHILFSYKSSTYSLYILARLPSKHILFSYKSSTYSLYILTRLPSKHILFSYKSSTYSLYILAGRQAINYIYILIMIARHPAFHLNIYHQYKRHTIHKKNINLYNLLLFLID